MNQRDIANVIEGIVPVLREIITEAQAPLRQSIATLERRVDDLPAAASPAAVEELAAAVKEVRQMVDGRGAPAALTIADVEPVVLSAVERAIAGLPPPVPPPVTLEDVAPLIEEAVGRAVGALPPAEPGKSVTIADVEPLILSAVNKAVAALPAPEPGTPGKSVTIEDVAPLVDEVVSRAVAALPPPKDGAPGLLPLVEDWTDRVYQAGETVSFEGSTFQARRLTGKGPTHEDWRCIARAGRDGDDGRALTLRSTWSAEETYAQLDVVTLDGGAFVARRDNPGACPGEGWMLLVQRGKAGKPGEKGLAGKGERGPAGPAVVDLSIDETGMVTLTNADGSTLEHDFAPVLSRLGR